MDMSGGRTWWLWAAVLTVSACAGESASPKASEYVTPGSMENGAGAIDPFTGQPLDPGAGQTGVPIAGSGATDTGGTPPPTMPVGSTPIPCDVAAVVASNCHTCHGPTPVGGAIRLVTHEDWHKPSPHYGPVNLTDLSRTVYEVAKIRINNGEMPQGRTLGGAEFATLDGWLSGGAVAGTDIDLACAPPETGGTGTTTPIDGWENGPGGSRCDVQGANQPLVAEPGETCYEFPTHGQSGANDTSKFSIQTGESYNQFYFDVPWPAGTLATRFGAAFDNLPVLHHWLAFDSAASEPAGSISKDVLGTVMGENASLIGGWAVGGCNVTFPPEMGLELPGPGRKIIIQWHHFNSTGSTQQDGSKVQFCTVPAGGRPNVGGMTWLGTENLGGFFGMPPGMNEFGGTCPNDSPGPITIVAFWPHMHTIGIHMRSEVFRGGGGTPETVFDQPFKFDYQIHYAMNPAVVLQPGDSIRSSCTFFNDTGRGVSFGPSTTSEMCYQFAFSYPKGALDNGVGSLIGTTDTCW